MQIVGFYSSPSTSSVIVQPSSKFSPYSFCQIKCSASVSSKAAEAASVKSEKFISAKSEKLLSARERRRLRNERREEAIRTERPWREVVEERQKRKLKKPSVAEQMNLDNLAALGVRWYMVYVRQNSERSAADDLSETFRTKYPDAEFEVVLPELPFRKKLKNGSYSKNNKLLVPGAILIKCCLNKEIHDLIRSCPSVREFYGYQVGNNSVGWINKPASYRVKDMEETIKGFKMAHEQYNCALEDEKLKEEKNKTMDNSVRQGVFEDFEHRDASIGKNSNHHIDSSNKLSNIDTSDKRVSPFDAQFTSEQLVKVFAGSTSTQYANEHSLKGLKKKKESKRRNINTTILTKPKDSNGRDTLSRTQDSKLVPGSIVRVTSGPFTEFLGHLKEFDSKTGKAKVMLKMFGNETPVDLEINQLQYEA